MTKAIGVKMENVLGKLEVHIMNDEVFEISIESFYESYLHKKSGWEKELIFTSKSELENFVDNLKEFFGVTAKEKVFSGYINEFLSISITLPPLALKGPSIGLFKLPKKAITLDDYQKWSVINQEEREQIERVLSSGEGVLCAGNTGSGKTTLYNMVLNSLPDKLSLVSIEPNADLVFQRERVCRLIPREETPSEVRKTMRAAALMGGDYISHGELNETWAAPYLELLQNNSRGIALINGTSPQNAIDRLIRQTVVSSLGYSLEEASEILYENFRYIIFQEFDKSNEVRKITSISKISRDENGEILLEKLK